VNGDRHIPSFLRWPLIVAVALAVTLFGGYVAIRVVASHLLGLGLVGGKTGLVKSAADWPRPLEDIVAQGPGVNQSNLQVFCLCSGIEYEFVWRMDATNELLEHLESRWQLTQVKEPSNIMLERKSMMSGVTTPDWWCPSDDGDTNFYECYRTLSKEKGDRFAVAVDTRRQTIFVHYWDNW
jgi:hypothetical protein